MAFTILAVVAGLVVAVARGWRPRPAGPVRLDTWPLAVAGVALLAAAETTATARSAFVLGLAGAAALIAVAATHVRLPGMALLLVGLSLNAAVLAANGTTPVRAESVVAAGAAPTTDVDGAVLGPGRALERDTTELAVLGRIVPVAPLRSVVSFGDLIVAVGCADLVVHLLLSPRRRREDDDAAAPLAAPSDGWDEVTLRSLGDAA